MALKVFGAGTIFAEVTGEAPEVLALHGWARSSDDFKHVLEGLSAVSVDLPGFGRSPAPPTAWGSSEYAAAVQDVWSSFADPPVVVAHSFGGRVAVHLAQNLPMRALVLIGVPLVRRAGTPRPAFAFRAARQLHRRGIISDRRIESYRQKYGSADYRATSGVMRDVFVKVVNETYDAQLDGLQMPVRMLWGSDDTAAPIDLARVAFERIRARGTDVELRVLDGVGHHVMAERPEVVAALIREFLA